MSLTRIKYGIEFDSRREETNGSSSGVGWIVVLVILIASVSFVVTMIRRISSAPDGAEAAVEEAVTVDALASALPSSSDTARPAASAPSADARRSVVMRDFAARPAKVKSLLLRLEEASARRDIENEVDTIEQLRALPGDAVADIDDRLVRKLGELNHRRLFELRNPQWVSEVTVKRGDSATRLAQENGSTLASLRRLNPSVDVDRLRIGVKLFVMNHPSFTLIVRKKLRTVDLHLNGKLFKRYTLPDSAPEIPMDPGAYRTPANLRDYFRQEGIGLAPADAAEIDALVPRDTPVRVSAS